jgi:predicted Fe-Mo cluster-binding NifX family protein
MDFKNSTIAIATDDGTTVSSHFGRAHLYEVLTFVDGKVTQREQREKAGHHSFAGGDSGQTHHDDGQHNHEEHEQKHQTMVSPVLDCQAVVVRGMGQGAVEHLRSANLLPILTGLHTIDDVIAAVAAGSLESDPNRIHQHHGLH